MALEYVISPESDFSQGIDARSAENQIPASYVADLLNADIVEKRARKRQGYQGFAGNIPVRVSQLEYIDATNQMCLTLDSVVGLDEASIDLGALRSTPIVVYGRSSSASSGGPITTTDSAHYYTGFTIPTRKTFLQTAGAPPYETISVLAAEHGIPSTNLFLGVVESTSSTNRSHTTALPHTTDVLESNADVTVSYQNSTGQDSPVFIYYKDQEAIAGQSYVGSLSHTGSGSETFTVSAATHALDNFNIIAMVQQDNGASRQFVDPTQFTISNAGDVSVTLVSSSAATFILLLRAAPIANAVTGNVLGGGVQSTVTLQGVANPWLFIGVYVEVTPGGDIEWIIPDSITYDDATATATVAFKNNSASAANAAVYWDTGLVRSNQLCVVDATVTTDLVDMSPQITVWGLDHTEIYGPNRASRSGWTNHLDSYRAPGERRLVAGLGGNLFTARTYAESGTDYLYTKLYPRLQHRTASSKRLGPLFFGTGDAPARTRGYITGDDSGTSWATVTAVEWDAGTTSTIFTLSVPSMAILDSAGTPTTIGSVISTTAGLEDYLTVSGMGLSRHNGTFKVLAATVGLDTISLRVDLIDNSSDFDDDGVRGQAGIFTDQVTFLDTATFIRGDILSNAATSSAILTAVSSLGVTTVISGFTDLMQMAGGLTTVGSRTNRVVPLRGPAPSSTSSVTNLVRGDMVAFTGTADSRLLRVLFINPNADLTVNLTDDGDGRITATLQSGSTAGLMEGASVLLLQAGSYSGTQTIDTITSDTTFEFLATSAGAQASGTLAGYTAQVDEELSWADATDESQSFTVERRWIPVEAPDDAWDLTPSTHPRYFDTSSYGDQPFLRSTMVVDNLYLTNQEDEVLKFDGQTLYRAGLFPWQLGLFLTQDTGASAKIVVSTRQVAFSAISAAGGYVTIASENALVLPVGSSIRFSGSASSYTVRDYKVDTTTAANTYMLVDRALDSGVSASGTVSEILTRRYYFRMNAVDANSNIVASAVSGSQDHVVELAANAAVQLKGVGLPSWDIYDYDRLEVEIYGTKLGTSAPFYKMTTLQLGFDALEGYFQFTDVYADSDLIDLDATISSGLGFGTELAIGIQEPLRASSITSIGNSLVLANLKDYPQLDIQMIASGAVTNTVFAGKKFSFLRDSADTGTTTSMPDRACYEMVNGTTGTVSSFTIGTNKFHFTTSAGTSAVEGDWIYLTYNTVATTGRDLTYSGWWQIATVVGTTVTVNLTGAASAGSYPNRYCIATDPTDIPVLLGADGNLGMVNGDSFDLYDTMRRMAGAINASMRMVDVSLTGMESFTPWLVARGGNDVGKAGRLIVRQPRSDALTFGVKLPASFGTAPADFQVFVNEVRRLPTNGVSAGTRVYPSRILVSFENYPEIFDNPTVVLDSESRSAIDVNSADGQYITGILPFFGQTAFTAAQQTTVLVVFKTNSIYLVDINEKRAGRNPVQRIESEGLGCTAPYSIAVTKKGIMFANESGIYCLRKDLSIEYIGKRMERKWTEEVNLDSLDLCQGHHFGTGRAYKLSVPLGTSTVNSEVYVYNHTGEDTVGQYGTAGTGAWGRYDNHPATGWANLDADAFLCSSEGRVLSIRRQGTATDFRDDNAPITFRLQTRAMDFGNGGIRKVLDRIVAKYRSVTRNLSTRLGISVDLSEEYRPTTAITIPGSASSTSNGVDDTPAQQIYPVVHTTDRRKGVYFSVEITNDGADEGIEVAGLDNRVGGLSTKGITTAAATARK